MTAWHGRISLSNPEPKSLIPELNNAMWAGVALMMAARRVQRVHVSAHAIGGTAPPTMTPAQSMQAGASAPTSAGVLIDRCTALRSEVAHGPSTCKLRSQRG